MKCRRVVLGQKMSLIVAVKEEVGYPGSDVVGSSKVRGKVWARRISG